jgi:tetratricopeptide (TPR) repeat protein
MKTTLIMLARKALRYAGVFLVAPVMGLGLLAAQAARTSPDMVMNDPVFGVNATAYRALQEGRVDEAAALLTTTLAGHPDKPAAATAHQLLCRGLYAQNLADAAIHECELAVATAPATSDNHLWLGRAYGLKARHAGPITAFQRARKVQSSFARAVELNGQSVAALNDLGEYYIDAPGIVGGGADKAVALAQRAMQANPAVAHRILALLAQSKGDYATAEKEFKSAVAVLRSPEAWVDLARFYQVRSRYDEAVSAAQAAIASDRARDAALVDAAAILIASNRALDIAERCLRMYLASPAKSDAAPAFKVHLQLSELLARRGDKVAASGDIAAAEALSASFARKYRQVQGS